jgi:phosphoenolpyruvate carboxykinase (GTP)
MDKKVWIRWIERRINGKVGAYPTPTGLIPKYEDLAKLFEKELATGYSRDDYELQFAVRVPELIEKLEIVEKFYQEETSAVPKEIFEMIEAQRGLLLEAQNRYGEDYISPFKFEDYEVPESLTKPF